MTSRFLVDTDVISFVLRGDTRASRFERLLAGSVAAVSFQTVAELYRGAYERGWGELRMARLQRLLGSSVLVPFSYDMALQWGRIMADSRHAGVAIGVQDAWIAATALVHGLPLLTNNRKDYAHIHGLELPDPDQ